MRKKSLVTNLKDFEEHVNITEYLTFYKTLNICIRSTILVAMSVSLGGWGVEKGEEL